MKKLILSFLFCFVCLIFIGQEILSGPMLGYIETREAMIWVQLDSPGDITLLYKEQNSTNPYIDIETQVKLEDGNIAHFKCTNLIPGTTYVYHFEIAGQSMTEDISFTTQQVWINEGTPPNFKFAIGSCNFVNDSIHDNPGPLYGGGYQIFNSICKDDPEFMLWLGDNTYMRHGDFHSKSGNLHRYTHTRSQPELQKLLKQCHHYAIWDDHDYGPNDADGSYFHKDLSLEMFKLFWANNGYGLDGKGITGYFQYNDCDFFLLDNRSFRTADNVKGQKSKILGKEQEKWLINALKQSTASFKFVAVGGQFLNSEAVYENFAQYKERDELIALMDENKLENVVFLTGDRHHAELSKMKLESGGVIYDLTTSPLTSTAYDHLKEGNKHRVKGTHYSDRNYATIAVEGSLNQRTLNIELHDSDGNVIWEKQIEQTNKK